jgi:hypothetical protein
VVCKVTSCAGLPLALSHGVLGHCLPSLACENRRPPTSTFFIKTHYRTTLILLSPQRHIADTIWRPLQGARLALPATATNRGYTQHTARGQASKPFMHIACLYQSRPWGSNTKSPSTGCVAPCQVRSAVTPKRHTMPLPCEPNCWCSYTVPQCLNPQIDNCYRPGCICLGDLQTATASKVCSPGLHAC